MTKEDRCDAQTSFAVGDSGASDTSSRDVLEMTAESIGKVELDWSKTSWAYDGHCRRSSSLAVMTWSIHDSRLVGREMITLVNESNAGMSLRFSKLYSIHQKLAAPVALALSFFDHL